MLLYCQTIVVQISGWLKSKRNKCHDLLLAQSLNSFVSFVRKTPPFSFAIVQSFKDHWRGRRRRKGGKKNKNSQLELLHTDRKERCLCERAFSVDFTYPDPGKDKKIDKKLDWENMESHYGSAWTDLSVWYLETITPSNETSHFSRSFCYDNDM